MIGGSEDDAPPGMVERVRANLGRYASLGVASPLVACTWALIVGALLTHNGDISTFWALHDPTHTNHTGSGSRLWTSRPCT